VIVSHQYCLADTAILHRTAMSVNRAMPLILGVLREPPRTSPDCVAAAAGCLKIVASRSPAAIELYEAEVTLSTVLNLIIKCTIDVVATTQCSTVT
jgi:hypothetical protein